MEGKRDLPRVVETADLRSHNPILAGIPFFALPAGECGFPDGGERTIIRPGENVQGADRLPKSASSSIH
jgi:hypothetical protein